LNLAWNDHEFYKDILEKAKGCLFLGVPHHGAGIANWADHGLQILKAISVGFVGNNNNVRFLKTNSKGWVKISDQFVQRGKGLAFRSFYETQKTGNLIVSAF